MAVTPAASADVTLFAAILGGYLLGSIPFGMLLARAFGLGDLRQIGSGNIGATNVLRTGSKKAAIATVILDASKGAVAVWIARQWGSETAAILAGVAAVCGHIYPVWLGFQGGKGVATFLGTLLAISWPTGLLACAIWLSVAFTRRISSLAALAAAAAAPVAAIAIERPGVALATLVMAALIFWRHRENIARLRAGTEPRIGARR